jgi:hypothetical protein
MTGPVMKAVVILGIPRQDLAHYFRYPTFFTPEENMAVVVHNRPGIYGALSFNYYIAQPLYKRLLVFCIGEDVCFIDPSHHYMVQGKYLPDFITF